MRLSRTATTIALAATTLLAFTGCGRGEDEASSGQSATLVMSTLNNPFFVSVADGARTARTTLASSSASRTPTTATRRHST